MRKSVRPVIRIDEEKCDGCGLCAGACKEGAIAIVGGKARLVSESFCDGLGACLGECPRGAIFIETREAEEFDEKAAVRARQGNANPRPAGGGCPGTMARSLKEMMNPDLLKKPSVESPGEKGKTRESQLANWPVQLSLVPINAPYLEGARLLLAADCTLAAVSDFHERFLDGRRILLMGCPKLDDARFYEDKIRSIITQNGIQSIEVVTMEVPCCTGLNRIVQSAVEEAKRPVDLRLTKVKIQGEAMETETIRYRFIEQEIVEENTVK